MNKKFYKFTLCWLLLYIFILFPLSYSLYGSNIILFLLIIPIIFNKLLFNKIESKINQKKFKILFSFIMLFLFLIIIILKNVTKEEYFINNFKENKISIYNSIVNNINNKKYDEAIKEAQLYEKIEDTNIQNYIQIAKERQEKDIQLKKIAEDNIKNEELRRKIKMQKDKENLELAKQKQLWLDTIKNDEKLNVGIVISDMAEAYTGLLKLEPNDPRYIKRAAYWNKENNEQKEHKMLMEKTFSESTYKLKKYLKDNLKDPDSLTIRKEVYYDQIDNILVEIEYTAKNSFNATVRETLLAKVNLKTGKITII